MAAENTRSDPPRPPASDVKPRALAGIQYNNLLTSENGTSSEDEVAEAPVIPVEDVRSVLGVAISQEQTRLTSPKTPAVEKAAAIERAGGFFSGPFDVGQDDITEEPEEGGDYRHVDSAREVEPARPGAEEDTDTQADTQATPQSPPESPEIETTIRLPSPWRAEARRFEKTGKNKSALRDGLLANRRRASSGPESTLDSWQRAIMASLPSMPRYFWSTSPSSPTLEPNSDASQGAAKPRSKRSSFSRPGTDSINRSSPRPLSPQRSGGGNDSEAVTPRLLPADHARPYIGDLPSELPPLRSGSSQLRRSASDQSLIAQRTLSTVSSLGDDTRFDHVSEQVNSRFKAIKDSLQDSNIKLPSLPSISSLSNFRPEFLRERTGSLNGPRQHNGYVNNHAVLGSSAQPADPMTRQPYHSAKEAMSDTNAGKQSIQHPQLNRALEQLEGDVVVLGGYRGSILRTAESPHRQVWVPIKVGLNLRKVDLELGLKEDDDERATEKIIPGGMLSHIGPVDISRRLFKRLRSCENARRGTLRVHDYGYDWRLHPLYLSQQMIKFLEGLPCNKPGIAKGKRGATVIAHSLGGLITRHAVNQRPELFKGVVYAGVPNTCVNILGPMRNGDEVLLSSRVLTAQVNFTIRTSFALLPLEGRCFFDKHTKEEYPVDFFDPKTWIDYRLSPCVARPLPPMIPQPRPSGIAGYMSSMASALPSLPLPGRKSSLTSLRNPTVSLSKAITAGGVAEPADLSSSAKLGDDATAQGNIDSSEKDRSSDADSSASVRTTVTIPKDDAIAYLTRTLASVKKFKQELAFEPPHAAANAYPPVAVIYGKSAPTVYGARVNGREGIRHADAYDELAFASGDGVVLARAAMVPEGYTTARGGVVSSDRGHVTLLGDLEAVGRCLNAVAAARRRGVGYGALS